MGAKGKGKEKRKGERWFFDREKVGVGMETEEKGAGHVEIEGMDGWMDGEGRGKKEVWGYLIWLLGIKVNVKVAGSLG